jgi:diacylglycerol kinase (ATP)
VVRRVNKSGKRLGPTLTFATATLASMVRYRGGPVRIESDTGHSIEIDLNVLFVCNAQYCGSGMRVGLGAKMDDGKFRCVAVEQRSLFQSLAKAKRLYSGELEGTDGVQVFEASKVTVTALDETVTPVECDGEQPGVLPATYGLLPGAINIQVSPNAVAVTDR